MALTLRQCYERATSLKEDEVLVIPCSNAVERSKIKRQLHAIKKAYYKMMGGEPEAVDIYVSKNDNAICMRSDSTAPDNGAFIMKSDLTKEVL